MGGGRPHISTHVSRATPNILQRSSIAANIYSLLELSPPDRKSKTEQKERKKEKSSWRRIHKASPFERNNNFLIQFLIDSLKINTNTCSESIFTKRKRSLSNQFKL